MSTYNRYKESNVYDSDDISDHLYRSDGAGSHFKNKCVRVLPSSYFPPDASARRFTLHYLGHFADVMELLNCSWDVGSAVSFRELANQSNWLLISAQVGCPGHGKGPWDGLAGTIKRTLRELIVERELNLRNEYEVFEQIRDFFDTEDWRADHQDYKISRMNVMWLSEADVPRPPKNSVNVNRVSHREYAIGVRSLFGFTVSHYCPAADGPANRGALGSTGLLLQRFSCGCPPCTRFDMCNDANVDGSADYDCARQCTDCHYPQRRSLCTLNRQDNVGVAAQKKAAARALEASLDNLDVGDFVAFETGDFRRLGTQGGGAKHSFNIGRVVPFDDDHDDTVDFDDDDEAVVGVAAKAGSRTTEQQEHRKGDRLVKLRLFDRYVRNEPLTFQQTRHVYLLNVKKSFVKAVAASQLTEMANPFQEPSEEDPRLSHLEVLAQSQQWTPTFKMSTELSTEIEQLAGARRRS